MDAATLARPRNADPMIARSVGARPDLLRERIIGRLRGPRSREQVARSLTLVVEEAFLDAAWAPLPHLRDALDEPIAAATEVAVATLVDELADLLDLVPETMFDTWERARIEVDLGRE